MMGDTHTHTKRVMGSDTHIIYKVFQKYLAGMYTH